MGSLASDDPIGIKKSGNQWLEDLMIAYLSKDTGCAFLDVEVWILETMAEGNNSRFADGG
jgi:hypothetical protein